MRAKGAIATALCIPFWPLFLLSALFGRLASWRLYLYAKGVLRAEKLKPFVISIGNLSSGGSGKTPLVHHLAQILSPFSSAILSRGYGSHFFRSATLINDEMGPLYPPELCGDEPYLLALRAKVPIVVDKDRVLGGKYACAHLHAQALLLDDGFQHRRLKRDCDIVLIEGNHIEKKPLCLPAGWQRNRLIDCAFADLVIITDTIDTDQFEKRVRLLKKITAADVVGARFDISALIAIEKWQEQLGNLSRKSDNELCPILPKLDEVFVCCALARPERFEQSLTRAGFKIIGRLHLPDHAPYDQVSAMRAYRRAIELGAKAIICTEKDAVKWGAQMPDLPIYVARSHWYIAENSAIWDRFVSNLKNRIQKRCELA